MIQLLGMMKKAASGVLAILPCSRTPCTFRASNNGEAFQDLTSNSRPCWKDFFEHSLQLMIAVSSLGPVFVMGMKYSTVPLLETLLLINELPRAQEILM
jgi:hypothetical protein